jgi:hypothetical protein
MIMPARHLDGAEALEVFGDELGIEQPKPAGAQPRRKPSNCRRPPTGKPWASC